MKTILVTGSKGFLGRSFIQELQDNHCVNIIEFDRNCSLDSLSEKVIAADFIAHFAGEVNPKCTDDEFVTSNAGLTESLVRELRVTGKSIPILFTSTIHAIEPKNAYGKSKQIAEAALAHYAQESKALVWLFRLPHVFGPGCKPNYNSAISTWIYNSINNIEIKVYDRGIKINYCYSRDIVKQFSQIIYCEEGDFGVKEMQPNIIYPTTLGSVVDLIEAIRSSQINPSDSFESKLMETYQSYLSISNDNDSALYS
ncbi:NAD-dependent epimerase/dehydratase family protein [Aeromonas media]|uniref:NAD-dependent epimerase/dehydratase family protein n=1 Tax=Aeromonas media TaxID=651 RepID=UPI0029DDD91C|nr:NAD-dependent epimerase/dehydratase family protein [Aeromonas media]MDX7899835.1 NAD-dependent epimerase/dehydratase family protein [Aeromonas media]